MASSSLPAWPTNGSPVASSSAPGASPTISQSARRSPTPGTVWVRVRLRPQAVQAVVIVESKSKGMKDKNDVFNVLAIEAADEKNLRTCEEMGHKVTT